MTTVLVAGGGTGGHLMPALAIADELHRRHPEWRIVLVGARRGVEARILPTRDHPHVLLPAEPIYRSRPWRNLRWPWLAVRLWREVGRVLREEQPALVVGTGGYAAGPVVLRAARRGIPTAIFEADVHPGITSRWLSRVAREIYLAVPEAAAGLTPRPGAEMVVTGAPIRPPDRLLRGPGLARFGVDPTRPVLLVTGGSQGAAAINRAVAGLVQGGLPDGLQLIWATGPGTWDEFAGLHAPPSVQVVPFLDPIGEAQALATIAVARGGSISLSELWAWGIPAIVVPLPSAAADHQTRNAAAAAAVGAAIHLPQAELSPDRLRSAVTELLADSPRLEAMRAAALGRARPGATGEIVTRLEGLLGAV